MQYLIECIYESCQRKPTLPIVTWY